MRLETKNIMACNLLIIHVGPFTGIFKSWSGMKEFLKEVEAEVGFSNLFPQEGFFFLYHCRLQDKVSFLH